MTTEQLRKLIKVTDWSLHENGLTISYLRDDSHPKDLHLILDKVDTARELSIVGSIDEVSVIDVIVIKIDGNWHTFTEMIEVYKMCQWEALAIAIRHEATKELTNDMNMLELNSAIDALK